MNNRGGNYFAYLDKNFAPISYGSRKRKKVQKKVEVLECTSNFEIDMQQKIDLITEYTDCGLSDEFEFYHDEDVEQLNKDGVYKGIECQDICENYGENYDPSNVEYSSEEDSDLEFDDSIQPNDKETKNYDEEVLHPSIETTKLDALQMILSYFMRHNLTFQALEDLLVLINTLLQKNSLPTTKHMFLKLFASPYSHKFHFYCKNPKCRNILVSLDNRDNILTEMCDVCSEENKIKLSSENYFITFPLKTQLNEIISDNVDSFIHPYKSSLSSDGEIADIKDGEIYKNFLKNKNNGNKKLTLVLNTDGVQVFKSRNKGLWPIQLIINELPVEKRFLIKNILVVGLFYEKDHPNMQTFLKPLMMELRELEQTGMTVNIKGENVTFDVALICGTFDAPAKATVQNIVQHNGFYSCHYCEHPGVTILNQVRYPIRNNVPSRTHENVLNNMAEASLVPDLRINGFKGFSALALAPGFDLVNGFAIDAMHSDYLGRSIKDVETNILKIKLSAQCDRNPRSILERANWKANEWRDCALHYTVGILFGILPEEYLENFCKFLNSILLLVKEKVSVGDITKAESLIEDFRKQYEDMYGTEFMTYNLHTFSHLTTCVEKLGPIWNYSNFPFESNNGVLVRFVKSPKGVLQQIFNKYSANRYLSTTQFSEKVSAFRTKISSNSNNLSSNRVLGKGYPLQIKDLQKINVFRIKFNSYNFLSFKKFAYQKILYTTKTYSNTIKTNDSALKLKNKTYGEISNIFQCENSDEIYLIVNLFNIDEEHIVGKLVDNYTVIIKDQIGKTVIISPSFIECKCLLINLENISYLSEWIQFYDHC